MSKAKAERLALADRIEAVPSYSGKRLHGRIYQFGDAEKRNTPQERVILVNAKYRQIIAAALRK